MTEEQWQELRELARLVEKRLVDFGPRWNPLLDVAIPYLVAQQAAPAPSYAQPGLLADEDGAALFSMAIN